MSEKVISELSATVGSLSPTTIWRDREEWLNMQNRSVEAWDRMDDEKREVVVRFVTHGLQELLETVEEWIPFALTVDEGKYVDVRFRLIMASMEAHLEEMKKITETQISEAAAGARALLGELENGRP